MSLATVILEHSLKSLREAFCHVFVASSAVVFQASWSRCWSYSLDVHCFLSNCLSRCHNISPRSTQSNSLPRQLILWGLVTFTRILLYFVCILLFQSLWLNNTFFKEITHFVANVIFTIPRYLYYYFLMKMQTKAVEL